MNSIAQLPLVTLIFDGQPVNGQAISSLENLVVSQSLCLPSQCELFFCQQDLFCIGQVAPGTHIRVGIGAEDQCLFNGVVTACEHNYGADGNQSLVIRAYDALQRLRKRQQLRQFDNVNLDTLFKDVTGDLGIHVETQNKDVELKQVFQWRQSDLALLSQNAKRYGRYFSLWEETLHLFDLSGIKQDIELEWGKNLFSASVELNTEPACRSVTTLGCHSGKAEAIEGQADAVAGSDIEVNTDPCQVGVSGKRYLTSLTFADSGEADMIAQASLDRRVCGEAIMQAVAQGSERLRPGARVSLKGLAVDFNGEYVLTNVTHHVNRVQGYVCDVNTVPPDDADREKLNTTFGSVVDIDDPDKLGRVKVVYPDLGMLESGWLEVTFPGAGPDKGLVVLPEVDDRVLVMFIDGEPSEGVVVGSLYGVKGPPDNGIKGGKVKKYTFTTPRGQSLSLDDASGSVTLKNRDGSFIRLSPGEVSVHADTDMIIEAPGKSLVFRANTIDFEQA